MPDHDDSAIRTVLDGIYRAFAANDPASYAAYYSNDAIVRMPGADLRGRDAVRALMTSAFAGPLRGANGDIQIQHIRRIGADVAVVHSRGSVVPAGQDPATAPPYLDTWVLARHDGGWAVEAFHSCPEQAG